MGKFPYKWEDSHKIGNFSFIFRHVAFDKRLTRTAPLRAHSDFDYFYIVGKAVSWRSGMWKS
jgi:hypothetical protein